MKEMQNWLKENLTEVWVEEIWLPSSPDCKHFNYFVFGVSELRVNLKPHNKTENLLPSPKDQGGDEVLRQEHHGEGLHELQVQDGGCLHS